MTALLLITALVWADADVSPEQVTALVKQLGLPAKADEAAAQLVALGPPVLELLNDPPPALGYTIVGGVEYLRFTIITEFPERFANLVETIVSDQTRNILD